MSFYGKKQKRSMCNGCSHWAKIIKVRIEIGEVDVSSEYCDSEETVYAGCSPNYPNLTQEERMLKGKQCTMFWKNYFKDESEKNRITRYLE